ncbi:hypothetical protein EDD86DRAFT_223547 [Gorgonomyces haynaldii]|nr:hypothetical protein EDD86DRAFT_223547 [Gorgonomyces haynaldii]
MGIWLYLADKDACVEVLVDSQDTIPSLVEKVNTTASFPPDVVPVIRNSDGCVLPLGPNIPQNTQLTAYIVTTKKPQADKLEKTVTSLNTQIEKLFKFTHCPIREEKQQYILRPAIDKAASLPDEMDEAPFHKKFSDQVYEDLKTINLDMWQLTDFDMVALIAHMFDDFGLVNAFKIDKQKLLFFLNTVRLSYNENPFHNFKHCFCVTQMMYALLNISGYRDKLTPLELLGMLVSAIGHDLDHPGFNNAYQVNAYTKLAITYNDISPLESHSCALLFAILRKEKANILSTLTLQQYRDIRKHIIACIMATDMARHGELVSKLKDVSESFNLTDANHRLLLFQLLMKCADISNEVRPNHVSEKWVGNLLEEFFHQSDTEKQEGLPFAPFMDRDKVTRSGAQVGFIGFVMIPLFEAVSKVTPHMDTAVIPPIREALNFYKAMA